MGLRRKVGRSAGGEARFILALMRWRRQRVDFAHRMTVETLTEHRHLRRLAVPLAHHVGAHTHVHASVALPRVGDHQLPATDLEEEIVTVFTMTNFHTFGTVR